MSGVHGHTDSNPQGLHNHPEIGVTENGGLHDHSIDAFGTHLHLGEVDDQYVIHVAGVHGHGLDAAENERNSTHDHMSPDVKVLKADIEISSVQRDIFAIIRKGQHTILGDDFDQAVDMVKAESRSSYEVNASDWGLRYRYQDLDGFYLIDKAVYGPEDSPQDQKKMRRKIAKLFTKSFGWSELCRVRGRSGNSLIVERTLAFQIENVEKSRTVPSVPEARSSGKEDDSMREEVLHSISLSKTQFSSLGGAQNWMKKNGIGYLRHLETGSEFTFYRGDIGLDEPHIREITPGVTAFFGKADGFSLDVGFVKFDDEKKIVYGIVYEPDVIDSQGDWATADDIETAAHGFMRTAKTDCVDTQHDFEKNGCHVVESFIARPGDPDFKEGSWVVATKVSDELWPMVKSGEINGYSMAGKAVRMFDQEVPSVLKSFEKSDDMDEDEMTPGCPPKKKMKKGHRLTNIQVDFISMVHRGANGKDFAFRKSDGGPSGVIFKSADLKIQENTFTFHRDEDGFVQKIVKGIMHALGRGQNEGTGLNRVPDRRVELSMDAKIDPGTASVLNLLKNLAGRAAVSETIVHAFAKSKAFEEILQNDPQLKETISKLDPNDLLSFEKQLGMFLQQGANTNGVTLPPLRNFFGFAMDPSVSPGRFLQGSLPGGGVAFGEPTVDRMPVTKGLEDLQDAVAKMQAEMAKLAGPPSHEAQKHSLEQQIAAALAPVAKSVEQITSTVEALKKSATADAPVAPVDTGTNGGQNLSTTTPAPQGGKEEKIQKSDPSTPENPFGDPADIFGGIRLNRNA